MGPLRPVGQKLLVSAVGVIYAETYAALARCGSPGLLELTTFGQVEAWFPLVGLGVQMGAIGASWQCLKVRKSAGLGPSTRMDPPS